MLSNNKSTNINVDTLINDLIDYTSDKLEKNLNKKLNTLKTDDSKQNAIDKYNSDLDNLKTTILDNENTLRNIVLALNLTADIKMLMLSGLKKFKQDYDTFYKSKTKGYFTADPEGIAMSDIDGNIVKLVDRSAFSSYNKDPDIESGWDHDRDLKEDTNSKLNKLLGNNEKEFINFLKDLHMKHKAYNVMPMGMYVAERDKGTNQEKIHNFWLNKFGLDTSQRGVGSTIAQAIIDTEYEIEDTQEYKDTLDYDDSDKLPKDEKFKIDLFYE